MDPNIVTLIAVVVMLGLMVARVPVAFCMGIAGILGMALAGVPMLGFNALGQELYSAPANFILVAIPMFVLMGQLIIYSGLGADLYAACEALFGRLPGGLAMASLGASTAFAAVTGISIVSCATIGPVAIKEMVNRKYDRSFAAGVLAASGGLAVLIPPSVAFILYGYIAQVSVIKLFMAGVVPGVIIALLLGAFIVVMVRRRPSLAPRGEPLPLRTSMVNLARGLPVFLIGLMILVFIYTGVTGVTESAAVGAVGAFVLLILYGRFTLKGMKEALLHTASTGGFYLMILVGALTFGYMLSYLRVPIAFTEFIVGLGLSKWGVLVVINVLLLILGCFLDGTSIMLMVVPVLLAPLLKLGFDPIWLGVIIVINIEIGFITPPFGINLFVIQGANKDSGVTFADVVKGSSTFIFAHLTGLVLTIVFPVLALWLPNTMK